MNTTDHHRTRIIRKERETARGPGPDFMAASTLEGDKVLTADGDHAGRIKAIMLDVGSGRVAYAVLSSGGLLGIGDKLLAIPWNELTLDAAHKCFVLSVSIEQVRSAPGFDKDHWPALVDPQWAGPIRDYYSSVPHWSVDDEFGSDMPEDELAPNVPGHDGRQC
ncbi:PRC-barrel domain-containing protein [Burkholderia sp. Bp8990]|uniref:PRC-barrel domain-containing protein n=1 Tax=Burkholderia sp. Bp8990 TaxID=2184552 RepID=UPI000F594C15|nr:PRC-barrel domain-containing protein [Burkholderia sp. Bp8990]RQS46140.1 PRC-barrel domain containing protein [Burkholderia sp. Bp8990]